MNLITYAILLSVVHVVCLYCVLYGTTVLQPSLLRMPAPVNFTFIKDIQCPVLVIV